MKHIWKFLAGLSLLAASAALTSCVKGDFDEPPLYIPTVDFNANTTISELKASYVNLRLIEEDIIIKGVIVANDESGNLYKELVIQDENSGIKLALDKTNLYNEFKLGQRVYVKCKGMYIGDYGGLTQLGYIFEGDIGRLPDVYIPRHLFRDSLPGAVPEPIIVSPNELNSFHLSRLVTLENISFTDPGAMWAPDTDNATDRKIVGSFTVVRTSKYSNFASETIPAGYGNVTGVLSIFNSKYQLTIRDIDDIGEFGGDVPPPPGGGDGSKENPYSVAQAIQKQGATPYVVGFVKGYIVGSVKSGVTTVASADDIHFSAPFTSATNVLIADTSIETNYMNCVIVNLPAGTSLRAEVNLLDNPENLGKWLNVKGTLRTYFGIGGIRDFSGEAGDFEFEGGGGGGGNSIFLEDFNTNLGTFTAYSVSGDQVWGWGNFDGGCAVMSGFVTPTSYVNEDWLISPAISLVGQTGVSMNFREAINYITSINDMKVLISTNYDGTSNPSTNGTWSELTGFTRAAGNNWTFVNSGDVSLASYEGQTIRIAFKYISSASASSTWEISRVEVK
jgi:hypothetical protein